MECPGSAQEAVAGSVQMMFDFDTNGECPVCHERCGMMLRELSPGRYDEVIKPHSKED